MRIHISGLNRIAYVPASTVVYILERDWFFNNKKGDDYCCKSQGHGKDLSPMNGSSVSAKYIFSGLHVQLNEVCKRFSDSHCDLFDKTIEEASKMRFSILLRPHPCPGWFVEVWNRE